MSVEVGDVVRLTDERNSTTVAEILPEGVAGYDERLQWRAVRFERLSQARKQPRDTGPRRKEREPDHEADPSGSMGQSSRRSEGRRFSRQ
jgi:hypothetical protein